mmetsp:Transcript_11000/g.25134  ORF Transcript_11000/g.25134 Transcript_11000/m.25134 type:complete len:284 (-) Transcript_11000:604-1455(-)
MDMYTVSLQSAQLCPGLHLQCLEARCLEVVLHVCRISLLLLQAGHALLQVLLAEPVDVCREGFLTVASPRKVQVAGRAVVRHAHHMERASDVVRIEAGQRQANTEASQRSGLTLAIWTHRPRRGVHVAPDFRLPIERNAAASVADLQGDLSLVARHSQNHWLRILGWVAVGFVVLPNSSNTVLQQLNQDVVQVRGNEREGSGFGQSVRNNLDLGRTRNPPSRKLLHCTSGLASDLVGIAIWINNATRRRLRQGKKLRRQSVHPNPRQEKAVQKLVHEGAGDLG